MQITATALAGLQAAEARLDKTSRQLARGLEPPQTGEDEVDLSSAMVSLIEARNAAAANVKVLQTAEEMEREILGSI